MLNHVLKGPNDDASLELKEYHDVRTEGSVS